MLLNKTAPIESKPLTLNDVSLPVMDRNEILVKIKTCGVCRSNLHLIEGDWLKYGIPPKLPIIPGHEIVGVVESTGSDVDKRAFSKGDRVGIQPLYNSCKMCEYCLTGREHLCDYRQITGDTENGGYAEFIKISADFAYRVPDNIDDIHAAPLFCPGVTAYRAVKQADLSPDKRVAIFGIGGVGHLALQIAKLYGAKTIAVTRSKLHMDLASKLGADTVLSSAEEDVAESIKNMGYADSVIIFAPSSEAIKQAIKSVKKGGTIVMGVFGPIGDDFMFVDEKTIKGSVIGSRKDMQEVLKIASEGSIEVFCESFPLSQANEVLERLKHGKVEARAVLTV
ncbi:MAG TPA: alcohol dehydrogenase catalytic domain-containing protein [Nitrososphaerales archaeon]|nr:alcohol dehydrogenase catalytic domain-containing protein [Nitrososphaerales archaeon]